MFFTYLWRELRRRMRQAVLIALGLALGVGLVITVTAASDGVKDSQATVLHTLYGVGTDITVTQPPAKGSGGGTSFGFRQQINSVRSGQIAAGTKASNAASVTGPGRVLGSGAAQALAGAGHTVSVTLTAPVTLSVIVLAVLLALAGGLVAGSFGGWRAARLRPAATLARVA